MDRHFSFLSFVIGHLSFKIVILGDVDRPEFAGVLHSVRGYPDSRAFVDLLTLEAWVQTSSPLPVIDAILILQSYSGEHPASVLNRIRQTYPITPVITVLGSWCEGELRTGWPLAGTHRIYWNDWVKQGENELFALSEGKFSVFALPPIWREEEILLEQTKRKTATESPTNRQCWIFTCRSLNRPDFEMGRLLQKRMQLFGFLTSVIDWDSRSDWGAPPEVLLWNPGLIDDNSLAKIIEVLKELREKLPQTTILLQTNSPRTDEIRTLCENGADRVISVLSRSPWP